MYLLAANEIKVAFQYCFIFGFRIGCKKVWMDRPAPHLCSPKSDADLLIEGVIQCQNIFNTKVQMYLLAANEIKVALQ